MCKSFSFLCQLPSPSTWKSKVSLLHSIVFSHHQVHYSIHVINCWTSPYTRQTTAISITTIETAKNQIPLLVITTSVWNTQYTYSLKSGKGEITLIKIGSLCYNYYISSLPVKGQVILDMNITWPSSIQLVAFYFIEIPHTDNGLLYLNQNGWVLTSQHLFVYLFAF
jgi:hypothetical protein